MNINLNICPSEKKKIQISDPMSNGHFALPTCKKDKGSRKKEINLPASLLISFNPIPGGVMQIIDFNTVKTHICTHSKLFDF